MVDEGLYATRPDLLMTGRTLMGHESAKNQQMDDHYFGSIPERVAEFMKDLEIQALELGIPCKTRHNEVAPNQFELAPIYEETNLAVDHNMLLMSLMKKIARKHGFRCLLHENRSPVSTGQANTTTGHWLPIPASCCMGRAKLRPTICVSSPLSWKRSWQSIAITGCSKPPS